MVFVYIDNEFTLTRIGICQGVLMFFTLILLFLSLFLPYFSTEPNTDLPSVIFSAEAAEAQNLRVYAHDPIDAYWTPNEDAVIAAAETVKGYLLAADYVQIFESIDSYDSQFFGYEINGTQFVFGNYFCDAFGADWQTQFVGVDDGGDCFFQFVFVPATEEIIGFWVNGLA